MTSFARRITEYEPVPGARVFIAPTNVKDLVTFEGSVLGGWNMLPGKETAIPALGTELFDAGTKTHTKKEIRESLAARGAALEFSSGGDRTYFYGSCLPEDLSFVLKTLAETLREPVFPVTEIATARARLLGELSEEKTDTRAQAMIALSRMIYDPSHVNYAETTAIRTRDAHAVTKKDLVQYQSLFGTRGMVLSVVGDIDTTTAQRAIAKALAAFPKNEAKIQLKKTNTRKNTGTVHVAIPDKANIDTYFGAAVPLTYDSESMLAFETFSSMLGGKGISTGHLMRTIRERDGLTYGIYVLPTGFEDGADGMFRIWATFSPDTFSHAVEKTRKEVAFFLTRGITEEALATKKDEMAGSYLVGLSTTKGLAGMLHKIGREGKPLSYLEERTQRIRTLTLTEIKAVSEYIVPDQLALAAAGTFSK